MTTIYVIRDECHNDIASKIIHNQADNVAIGLQKYVVNIEEKVINPC